MAVLADIATGLAEAEELWRPHVVHDAVERARLRLLASPVYEVWLLGWTPGQSVGLHDHGGANGAFVVVDGTLTETSSAAAIDRTLVRTVLGAGDVGLVPAGAVHDVANRSARNATSIHAYSRPLTSMGFYASSAPDRRGARVRTCGSSRSRPDCPLVHPDVLSRRPLDRVAAPPSRRRGRAVSPRIDTLLERARRWLERVAPQDLADEVGAGAVLVDIRPAADRRGGRAARRAS